jgi:hypothetical protein
MAKAKPTKLEVSFTGVSFGKDTARIGVKMARDKALTLVQTEALLCGARLECTLSVIDEDGVLIKGAAAAKAQQKLARMARRAILEGKRLNVAGTQ